MFLINESEMSFQKLPTNFTRSIHDLCEAYLRKYQSLNNAIPGYFWHCWKRQNILDISRNKSFTQIIDRPCEICRKFLIRHFKFRIIIFLVKFDVTFDIMQLCKLNLALNFNSFSLASLELFGVIIKANFFSRIFTFFLYFPEYDTKLNLALCLFVYIHYKRSNLQHNLSFKQIFRYVRLLRCSFSIP